MIARIALAQIDATANPERNLSAIAALTRQVAGRADLLVLPEYSMCYPSHRLEAGQPFPGAQPLTGPFVTELRALARQSGLWLCCGVIEDGGASLPFNTQVLIDSAGQIVRAHRKTHLYNAFSYRESDHFARGDVPFQPVKTPFGKLGLIVCYELRFPELARRQAIEGAQILLTSAAFVRGPGKVRHWHTLLAARAIENGLFVLGANHTKDRVFLGESAAYDPDGGLMSVLDDKPGLLLAACDLDQIGRVRARCPAVLQRREEVYAAPY